MMSWLQLMGGEKTDINIKINPSIILIAGLQGCGKTTFSGKLAKYLKSKERQEPAAGGRRRLQACGY
ncbi:MAG: hypothetical protein MZV63_22960 [Marinilabiliales bacterium]|nr:hypothetical protein [Marinilabiliales bacterium]